jgi:hypothetical protein
MQGSPHKNKFFFLTKVLQVLTLEIVIGAFLDRPVTRDGHFLTKRIG